MVKNLMVGIHAVIIAFLSFSIERLSVNPSWILLFVPIADVAHGGSPSWLQLAIILLFLLLLLESSRILIHCIAKSSSNFIFDGEGVVFNLRVVIEVRVEGFVSAVFKNLDDNHRKREDQGLHHHHIELAAEPVLGQSVHIYQYDWNQR